MFSNIVRKGVFEYYINYTLVNHIIIRYTSYITLCNSSKMANLKAIKENEEKIK